MSIVKSVFSQVLPCPRGSSISWRGYSRLVSSLCSYVDRRLDREIIRFVCLAILGGNLAVAILGFLTFDGSSTIFGPPPGADFPEFYAAGRILNELPAQNLYDLDLQYRVYHEVLPHSPAHVMLPFLYAPFFALVFRPLALLSYAWACATWMIVSVAAYLLGLNLIWRSIGSIPSRENRTVYLLALSFQPFLECVLSGQSSIFGFLALALAFRCESMSRPLRAGLYLALCFYKPNLLCLFLPWLVLARKWKMLAGLAAGGTALCGVSLLAMGWSGCQNYAAALTAYPHFVNSHSISFPRWKFVDLYSFLVLLLGNASAVPRLTWAFSLLLLLPILGRTWSPSGRPHSEQNLVGWGSVITWTLILDSHAAVYDLTLIVVGLMITTDLVYRRAGGLGTALTPAFKSWLVLLYMVPWFSQIVARFTGLQPATLVLIGIGACQVKLTGYAQAPDQCHRTAVGPTVAGLVGEDPFEHRRGSPWSAGQATGGLERTKRAKAGSSTSERRSEDRLRIDRS